MELDFVRWLRQQVPPHQKVPLGIGDDAALVQVSPGMVSVATTDMLMEDVDFFRAMHRCGRVRAIETRLRPSVRRFEMIGVARLNFAYGLIAGLYALGFSRDSLGRIYDRFCNRPPT